jgi:hypothetical protein
MMLLRPITVDRTIAPEDLHLLLVTDNLDEAATHLRGNAIERFELRTTRQPKPLQ